MIEQHYSSEAYHSYRGRPGARSWRKLQKLVANGSPLQRSAWSHSNPRGDVISAAGGYQYLPVGIPDVQYLHPGLQMYLGYCVTADFMSGVIVYGVTLCTYVEIHVLYGILKYLGIPNYYFKGKMH
jgi:hypothetical protein